jgi:hypothetical protein
MFLPLLSVVSCRLSVVQYFGAVIAAAKPDGDLDGRVVLQLVIQVLMRGNPMQQRNCEIPRIISIQSSGVPCHIVGVYANRRSVTRVLAQADYGRHYPANMDLGSWRRKSKSKPAVSTTDN